MARRTGVRVVRTATRREMVWLFIQVGTTTITGSSTTLLASFNAAALALRPFTIVRTRFLFVVHSD